MPLSISLATEDSDTIFQCSWYLDAVVPGQWEEVSLWEGGKKVARLPYISYPQGKSLILRQHPCIHTLGPWIRPLAAKRPQLLAREQRLIKTLIEKLPSFVFFRQHFHYSRQNWLPFYWKGFQQTTAYTYILENLHDLDSIWEGMASSTRQQIRKAKKNGIVVEESEDINSFLRLWEMTWTRQNKRPPLSAAFLRHFHRTLSFYGAATLFLAYDREARPHYGLLAVHDSRAFYYLLVGSDPSLRSSGAGSLTVWTSIQAAAKRSHVYDFEGSKFPQHERFFRGFGGEPKPYFVVTKNNLEVVRHFETLIADTRFQLENPERGILPEFFSYF